MNRKESHPGSEREACIQAVRESRSVSFHSVSLVLGFAISSLKHYFQVQDPRLAFLASKLDFSVAESVLIAESAFAHPLQ